MSEIKVTGYVLVAFYIRLFCLRGSIKLFHLDLPYRTKQCRRKVTKFFAGDENFVRRKILSGK